MTPLRAADGDIYAVAQGPVAVGGFTAQGSAEKVTQGVPTTGRVPNGAIVERQVQAAFGETRTLTLQLRNPDFSTAVRVADAINAYARQRFGKAAAAEQDARTVLIDKPKGISAARFYAELENIVVETDTAGPRGRRRAHRHHRHRPGRQDFARRGQPRQPDSAGDGNAEGRPARTLLQGRRRRSSPARQSRPSQPDAKVAVLDGPDLQTLVAGLNRLGVKPDGIIAILQGIKSAGALQADLVVQ